LPIDPATLEAQFHARHHELFGYSTREPCVIESLRVQARQPSGMRITRPSVSGTPRAEGTRICSFDGAMDVETALLDRDKLAGTVSGPAIIQDAWSTVIVPPGWSARPDDLGNLFLSKVAA
jgi:N-methylhydantoinase A